MCYANLEKFFNAPESIENNIVCAIRSRNKELLCDVLEHLSSVINENGLSLYPEDTFIKKHILDIAEIIWKNNWEIEEWDNESIYDEDFKRICRTTFYIPFIFMDLLSGEYIMYLLHEDKLKLDYHATDSVKVSIESDEEYRIKRNAEILKRKNENMHRWMQRFEEVLDLSFEVFFQYETQRGKVRKGTEGYQMFEEYGYAVYEINKADGRSLDLLRIYDEPYVNNIGKLYLGRDLQMLERCDGTILFKTILFQHLRLKHNSRISVARFFTEIHRLVKTMQDLKKAFEDCLAYVSNNRKVSSAEVDDKYKRIMEDGINHVMSEVAEISEIIKDGDMIDKDLKPVKTDIDVYKIVMWKILLLETGAVIRTLRNTYSVKVESNDSIEKLHQYIRMNPKKPMMVNKWNLFKGFYSSQLEEFFPNYNEKELEEIWLMALKTIAYCDSARFGMYSNHVIPKKINEKWLENNDVELLPTGGVFATMLLIDNAKRYRVRLKEVKIWDNNDEVTSKKIYHHLLSEDCSGESTTLYTVIKNLEKDKCTTALVMQLRQLTREYISGYRLSDKNIMKSREVQLKMWDVYDEVIEKAESIEICSRHTNIFLMNIENIMNYIEQMREKV